MFNYYRHDILCILYSVYCILFTLYSLVYDIMIYICCYLLQGTKSEVIRNIEAELVVPKISPPSITFLQFHFLREISVDNHQAAKQGIIGIEYSHDKSSLLGRKEIFVN